MSGMVRGDRGDRMGEPPENAGTPGSGRAGSNGATDNGASSGSQSQAGDLQALSSVQVGKTTRPMPAVHSMRSLTSEAIENQLMLMWRQAARAELAAGKPVVAHNSVMTLIAFTGDKERSARIEQVVSDIIAQVAARAIVLIPVPKQPPVPPLDVSISIQERNSSGQQAHGEAIVIKAHDDTVPHLPGAVLPLVLSGLPAFLWWSGEPPWHTELFDALVDGCDRLIVDTSETISGQRTLFRLNELSSRKKTSLGITDLNWFRQEPWRELVAQFFDDASTRGYLYGIERVRIEYAAGATNTPTNAAQAYLFAGWLASRLGWVPYGIPRQVGRGPEREHTALSPRGTHITLELAPLYNVPIAPWIDITTPVDASRVANLRASNGAPGHGMSTNGTATVSRVRAVGPGALMSVRLEAVADGKPGTFAVTREADLETATTQCEADCAMPVQSCHLPTLGEAQSLVEQLRILGHDTLYEQALSMAAHLAGPDGRRSST